MFSVAVLLVSLSPWYDVSSGCVLRGRLTHKDDRSEYSEQAVTGNRKGVVLQVQVARGTLTVLSLSGSFRSYAKEESMFSEMGQTQ